MSNALNNIGKLSRLVFVTEARWGVKADGSTDDSAAIQACIDANPGKVIFFPPATYRITSTLTVSSDSTFLYGFGRASRILNATTGGDAIHFTSTASLSTSYLNNVGMQGLYISRSSTASAGAGLRLTRVNSGHFSDFYILDCPEGLQIRGGQLTKIFNFEVFASSSMSDLSGTADTNLLGIDESATDGGTYQPCYTLSLSHFNVSASNRVQCAMRVASVDGLQGVNGYFARGKDAVIRYKSSRNGSYIAGVTWASTYFDAVNMTTGAANVVHIPDDSNASSFVYSISHAACDFGNCTAAGVLVRKAVSALGFDGGTILNTTTWGIDYEPGSTSGTLTVSGTRMTGNSSGGATGVIRVSSATQANLSPTIVTTASASVYTFAGTVSRLHLGGTASGGTGLMARSGTITFADYSTAYAGSFTPTISFAGGTTGLTTSTASATYSLSGGRCMGSVLIVLTAKGSSTGEVRIEGVPFTPLQNAPCGLALDAVTSGVGDTHLSAVLASSTSRIRLFKLSAGTNTPLTDADLTNTTTIQLSFNYAI